MTATETPTAREWLVRIFERGNRLAPSMREHLPDYSINSYYSGPNWFRCADGTQLSVIAGWGTYCTPRPDWPSKWGGEAENYSGPYTAVEVWFSGTDEPDSNVEADRLWAYVAEHGGIVDYCPVGEDPESRWPE